jgi:predicted nucleotidyltransferase
MSGSAGGNRIPRSAVEKTVKEYINKVLSKVPGFRSAKVSGSYNTSEKQDFGDIDLITSFEGEDKKEFKKQLSKYLESLPDNVIVPFKSEKYAGKKTMNTGEIITVLYPISGMPGEFVQIDNIIALSEEEGNFKKTFLDYPAEIQGLILGLVKVVTLEEDPNKVIAKMGIKDIPALEPNQEYEFNLSSAGLTLRIVTLGKDYKQLERTDVWKSSSWGDVKKLLAAYNIDQSFKDLVSDLKKLKNPRSRNRIKGIFKSMVSIKSGEVNTPKGDNKQMALDTVAMLEGKYKNLIQELISSFIKNNKIKISKTRHKSNLK